MLFALFTVFALPVASVDAQTIVNKPVPKTVSIGNGLKLDIYRPANAGSGGIFGIGRKKVPVLLYVHGGGWIKGSRKKVYRLPQYAASRGYMLVSVDYRPVPRTTIDGQVSDVVRGINWTRKNIKRYGGDPKRIVIMGHSAGSHLVSMVAAKNLGGKLRGVVANDVQAYDMIAYGGIRGSLPHMYRKAFTTNPANWRRWSPITYVRQGRAKRMPPHLIMHSGGNILDRRAELSNGYASALRRRGTKVTVFNGRNYSHGAIAARIGKSPQVTAALDRFLKRVF